jgi:conjugal transfer ATP-binding protein TraC
MISDHPSSTALLPYHSFDPDGAVFVQTDGSIGVAWEVGAIPCDAGSEHEMGAFASRLDGVLKLLPEGCAAQAILVASRDVGERLGAWAGATTAVEGSILRDLTTSRVLATKAMSLSFQGAPFVAKSLRRYLTIRLFPKWASIGISGLLGSGGLEARLREGYAKSKKELLDLALALENGLLQAGIGSRRLSEDVLVGLALRMLHPGLGPGGKPLEARPDRLIRERLALSHLTFNFASGTVASGASFTKVLSAIDLPMVTWAGMLTLGLPSVLDYLPECVLVFNIEVPPQEEVKRLLGRKKRLAFCQLSSGDVKVDMAAMKSEVDHALGEMFMGSRVLSARMHLVLSDSSINAIEARARSVVGILAQAGLTMVEEKGLALSLVLQALPLAYSPENDRWLRRGRKMMGANLAHLLPFYGSFQGTRSPDLLFVNRRGEPISFSFFDSNVAGHGIVCGVSGSGKSVFANNLIMSVLRRGSRVFVLDRGNSYRKLCRLLGGDYVEFHPDRPRSVSPCGKAGPQGQEISREKLIFLRDLVAEMATRGREDLKPQDQSLVEAAVQAAFRKKPGQEVFVKDIREALEALAVKERRAHDLALCLSSFAGDGPYGAFFDGPGQIDFDRQLIVFELGETALEKSVVSSLLMSIIHRIGECCAGQQGEKYVLIDEAWTLLRSQATSRFIENVFRTYRKYRTAALMITQQVADFEGPTGAAIRANAPNRIYLRQTPETILAMEKLLDLSAEEKRLLGSLTTIKGRMSEFLVSTPEVKGVARLIQDPLAYWVTTSDPADNAYLEELVRKRTAEGKKDALADALREAAQTHPNGRPR